MKIEIPDQIILDEIAKLGTRSMFGSSCNIQDVVRKAIHRVATKRVLEELEKDSEAVKQIHEKVKAHLVGAIAEFAETMAGSIVNAMEESFKNHFRMEQHED